METSRTTLAPELADEIRTRVFETPGFMKLTQSLRRGGSLFRISLRPVLIKNERMFQGEMTDDGRTSVKNMDLAAAQQGLQEILDQTGPRELHLMTGEGDLHVRITKKGRALVSRSAAKDDVVVPEAQPHDRIKQQPLNAFESTPLLKALGIADANGDLRISMRGKYDQINEFLREAETLLPTEKPEGVFGIVDCGCGKAYLTFAMYAYLTQVRGWAVRIAGIDKNPAIVQHCRDTAKRLDAVRDVIFIEGDIATTTIDFEPELMISLHACDTATDEALARASDWKCRYILCSPCCQHELQKQLAGGGPMKAILRHGILRERLADVLTDTFRAQILRILGFRVRIVEFVSQEATARNLLIRAEHAVKPGQIEAIREYIELRDFWKTKPYLETRLAERLSRYFTVE